jgi:transposase
MTATLRVHLSDAQRTELRTTARARGTPSALRERLEMIALADAGWTVPHIARHLGRHEQTVRRWVKAFLAVGLTALPDPLHPGGRPRRVTDAHLDALTALLDTTERTWTTRQLVDWLGIEQGVRVHPLHLSRLLHRRGYHWKRTRRSLVHKRRDPDLQAAKRAELEALKKAGAGRDSGPLLPG